ncbi:MAG: amino acid racemase [Candidatus Woesearchaeota archaeon]|nr:amino acid racemase [Candidatus Woesearchaeota archaeon]
MKQRILGVIGGLGPETGCTFCLNVNRKFKLFTKRQPHIVLDNLPISQKAEERLIKGGPSQEHLDLLLESVHRPNRLDVDFIVIPCNTVHIFIDELREKSRAPILSIVEETTKKCREMKRTKVGILGSTKTIQSGLHATELKKGGIESITPNEIDQRFVSECILRIINNKIREDDKEKMRTIIEKLENRGAEGILLGCTELPRLISNQDAHIPIINTIQILEDASIVQLI